MDWIFDHYINEYYFRGHTFWNNLSHIYSSNKNVCRRLSCKIIYEVQHSIFTFFTIALVCYRNLEMVNYQILNYINLISSIFIFELAPLENKNKVIDDLKKRKYRNIDMSIYILGSIVGILIKDMFLINVLAIVLCNVTVLLLIGRE